MKVKVSSFGHLFGPAPEADLVLDVRHLPNPHFVPGLKEKTGIWEEVQKYVLGSPATETLLESVMDWLQAVRNGAPPFQEVHVAFGCSGGAHRSVALAEILGYRLMCDGVFDPIEVDHRDLWRHL